MTEAPDKSNREARLAEVSAVVNLVAARLNQAILLTRASDKPGRAPEIVDAVSRAESRLASLAGGRLTKLLALFGCQAGDRAILLTCLAPLLEPGLLARYAEIQGRPWATETLAALLFGLGREPILSPSSAVRAWRLVTEERRDAGEPPALEADPALRQWMSGGLAIEPELQGALTLVEPQAALQGWPVEATAERVKDAVARGERAVIAVEGLKGAGRATFAAQVAEQLGQRCFSLDPAAIGTPWDQEATIRAHRFALVAGAVLAWRTGEVAHLWPRGAWPPPVQALILESGETPPALDRFAVYHTALPVMDREERSAMIARLAPASTDWSEATRTALAERRALTPGEIRRLGRIAPGEDSEALSVANQSHAAVMGELAQRVVSEIGWDDLVLPEKMKSHLADLAFECRARSEVWSDPKIRRLFGRERGLVALFQGPPGTGKTMSAQVIANDLGLDLYRIDCATVTSKYIGETAKNLRRIFARARKIDAVLFFDEADALFARRTEVKDSHDRHANADTSYLLQLIEGEFDGFAILATNRMNDMDPAFMRRIRYVFDFPRPTPQQRGEIWRRSASVLLPADATLEMEGLWPVLADCLDITGAQIKTTLLSAHFAARRRAETLGPDDILRAAEREFAKEGHTIGQREKQRIASYG